MSNNGQDMSLANLQRQSTMDVESHYRLQAVKCRDDEVLLAIIVAQTGDQMKMATKMIKIDKKFAKLAQDDGMMFQIAILPYGVLCLWGSLYGTLLEEWQVALINGVKGDTIKSVIENVVSALHIAKLNKKVGQGDGNEDGDKTDEDDQTDNEKFPHLIV